MLNIEHIRHRPAMYIGGTNQRGLMHMFQQVIGYFAAYRLFGYNLSIATKIDAESITVYTDGWYASEDCTIFDIFEKLLGDVAMDHTDYPYAPQFGTDLGVVNALSQTFEISFNISDRHGYYCWARGVEQLSSNGCNNDGDEYISICWHPDPEIFESISIDALLVHNYLKKFSPLLRDTSFRFLDIGNGELATYNCHLGVAQLVENINSSFTTFGETFHVIFDILDQNGETGEAEIAIQFHAEPGEAILSACNLCHTGQGGSHANGFFSGIVKATRENNPFTLLHNDARLCGPGYTAMIAVRLRHPIWEGPTRSKIYMPEIEEQIELGTYQAIRDFYLQREKEKRRLMFWQ